MKAEKRDRFRIYYQILVTLSVNMQNRALNLTSVARKVNIPYDRFQRNLDQLVELHLLVSRERLVLTRKGLQYVKKYKAFDDFLWRLGLVKRSRASTFVS